MKILMWSSDIRKDGSVWGLVSRWPLSVIAMIEELVSRGQLESESGSLFCDIVAPDGVANPAPADFAKKGGKQGSEFYIDVASVEVDRWHAKVDYTDEEKVKIRAALGLAEGADLPVKRAKTPSYRLSLVLAK